MKKPLSAIIFALCLLLAAAACTSGGNSAVSYDLSTPRILAHRGGRAEQEENTLEAFRATYEAGCHGFETDIHMTADGELVIMHDHYLGRMTTGHDLIEGRTSEYIRSITTKQGRKVPFLSELMEFFNGCRDLYVEFELKTNEQYYPEDVLKEYCDKVWDAVMPGKPSDALYVFSSFDPRPLKYIRETHPEAEVMFITGKPCCAEVTAQAQEMGIHRLACYLNGTSRAAVRDAHKKGIALNLWPGQTVEDTQLAALLGADFLCTDIPQEVMACIKEKNLPIRYDGPVGRYTRTIARTAPALAGGAEKKLVVMDLDGTLSQHRTPISPETRAVLDRLAGRYSLLMAGGGSAERIYKQMEQYPIDILGNYGMQEGRVVDGQWQIVRQESVSVDTAFFIEQCSRLRQKYGHTDFYGESFEVHKSGMVTFGLAGTEAPIDVKLAFDPDKSKRRAMFPEMCEVFKDYSVFIGGTTSFDIAKKEFNKYDAVMRYAAEKGIGRDEIIFFGDDLDDGGNDSHIRLGGMDYIRVYDYADFPLLADLLMK